MSSTGATTPLQESFDAEELSAPDTRSVWRRHQLWPYGYMAPVLAALALVFGYSFVEVVRYSFYAGSVGELTYVGTSNYKELFSDPQFIHSMFNNFKLDRKSVVEEEIQN